ncbi:hypothetical protein QJQ45_009862 [Haematococcus lacustris]|nr:hypothetical protein QJQ45_009862 [Haematococcus lacustris]
MGASASLPRNEALFPGDLPEPIERGMDCLMTVLPQSEELMKIHSWAHDDQLFNFRFFDEKWVKPSSFHARVKRSIVQHVVLLQHLNKLLGHIQLIIDQILEERKSQVISDEGFHRLLQQLQQQAGQDQMQLLATNAKHHYFMARQGRQLLEALASGFDKVEASVLLHGRLVDQNCFAHMLEALDSPADRDNVWHRIILARKAASHP